MRACWTCAEPYDPKETSSPMHYCSIDCYRFGERPYNKGPIGPTREDKIQAFASKLVDKMHYLQHNNDDRFDCEWDLCVEAKILGL